MDTSLSTNILFSLLSLLIVVWLVAFAFIAVLVVKLLKSLLILLGMINKEGEKIVGDINNARLRVKNAQESLKTFFGYVAAFLSGKFGKKNRTK